MPIITTVTSSLGIANNGSENTRYKEADAALHQSLIAGLRAMKLTGKAPKQVGGQFSFQIETVQESVDKLMQTIQPNTKLIILGSGESNELQHRGPYNFRVIEQARAIAKDAIMIVLGKVEIDHYNYPGMQHPTLNGHYNNPTLALKFIRELLVETHKIPTKTR